MHIRGGGPPDSRPLLSSDDGDPAVALIKLPEFVFPMAPNSWCKLPHGSAGVGGRSITSLGWIYRSTSGHKILTANHVLGVQQINPSHHLMGVVCVMRVPQTQALGRQF